MHALRALVQDRRLFFQLTRCKSHRRPMHRGDARDGRDRPTRALTCARPPDRLAPCWQGARKAEKEVLQAHVNMMSNVFERA